MSAGIGDKDLFQITYESVVKCINVVKGLVEQVHDKCSEASECRKCLRKLNDMVGSLITRANNAPQLAYTWGPGILLVNEFSRLEGAKSLELLYKVYTESTENLGKIAFKDHGGKKCIIDETAYGYALHLGIITLALKKAAVLAVDNSEANTNNMYGLVGELLSLINKKYMDYYFEESLLRIIEYSSRIIVALLEPLVDEINEKLKEIRETENVDDVKQVLLHYIDSLSKLVPSV